MFAGAGSSPAFAEFGLNLTEGVTSISKEVYDLHMLVLAIVTVIGILVFGALIYTIYHHRQSKHPVPAKFSHNTAIEIAWTVIPIVILICMAIPATTTLIKMKKTEDAELTVKITGYQWKWHYDYMDEGFGFFSSLAADSNEARQMDSSIDVNTVPNYLLEVDRPIVLPVKTKVRLLTTAADVLHSWWVPDLGWKRDAIPGFINDNWTYIEEEGTYRGQCAELCGRDHAFMPIVLKAVSRAEYDVWVAKQKTQAEKRMCAATDCTMDELMAAGEQLYGVQCSSCHQANGQGMGELFPALAGSAIATGPAEKHINIVLNGKKLMPAFSEQLSDDEIAAIITYERNAWGNNVGDLTQPAMIKAAR
ncbi:MAG: cytochrome c oxidase subunit II [Candidatus Eutrophobiaceae bacterium]